MAELPTRSLPSLGTPVKMKRSGSANIPYTTGSKAENPDHITIKNDFALDTYPDMLGGMPTEEFCKLIPCEDEEGLKKKLKALPDDLFSTMPSTKNNKKNSAQKKPEEGEAEEERKRKLAKAEKIQENDMYLAFIKILRKYNLCPGLAFMDTSGSEDPHSSLGHQWKPDISFYNEGDQPEGNPKFPDFSKILIHAEFKTANSPPVFKDAPKDADEKARRKHQFLPLKSTEGMTILGQLLSVMTEICARQFRTHVYMIFLRDSEVRFLRADRAGVIVSEVLNFRTNPRGFAEFLLRFSQATDEQRGLDSTVCKASKEETILAKEELTKHKPAFDRPVVKIEVPDSDSDSGFRQVLAWGSTSSPESLTGRGTRTIPVWDLTAKKVCFLKDSWRAEHLEREAQILEYLHEKKVNNIPDMVAGGDLYNPANPSDHRTITQIYVDAKWRTGPVDSLAISLEARIHHRILENFILESISSCKNAKEMVTVIRDALIAHSEAFEAGVLHRDISNNNVLMIRDTVKKTVKGILADWDMAIRFTKDDAGNIIRPSSQRQRHRTGTWYFMSALLLKDVAKAHMLQDDLESFFHLGLYLSLHWFPWTGPSTNLENIIDMVFGEYYYDNTVGFHLGGYRKQGMIENRDFVKEINFTGNRPLTSWIDAWFEALGEFYDAYRKSTKSAKVPLQLDQLLLCDHSWIMSQTHACLDQDGWSATQNKRLQEPSRMKRKEAQKRPASDPPEVELDGDSIDQEGTRWTGNPKRQKEHDPSFTPSTSSRGASGSAPASGSDPRRSGRHNKSGRD